MKESNQNTVQVAVVQGTPFFFDVPATLEQMKETLRQLPVGTDLVLFPESYLPGYPRGLDFGVDVGNRTQAGRELWRAYWENSVQEDDLSWQKLAEMATRHQVYLATGITEKDPINRTLYCSWLLFAPDGKLVTRHRKIKPTGSERVIWGEGIGDTLQTHPTRLGRIGGLICWENYMPEARAVLYKQGLDIYLAPTADARDSWTATMRHIACESRSFVLSANQFFTKSDYPAAWQSRINPELPSTLCRGGSVIVSPYGEILAGPLYDTSGVLLATIDLNMLIESRMDFDPAGHYSRPDLFHLTINMPGQL